MTLLLGGVIAVDKLGPLRAPAPAQALYQAEAQRANRPCWWKAIRWRHAHHQIPLNLEPRREESWDNAAAEAVRTYVQVSKISLAATTFSQFIEKALTVTIVVAGAFLVFNGRLTVGGLVAFNMLSSRVTSPVLQLIGLLNNYQETMMSVEMLGEIMNRPQESNGQRGLTPALSGRYRRSTASPSAIPAPKSRPCATSRLTYPLAGSMVGIVGRSGSGKTTLSALLQGLRITPAKAPSASTATISAT